MALIRGMMDASASPCRRATSSGVPPTSVRPATTFSFRLSRMTTLLASVALGSADSTSSQLLVGMPSLRANQPQISNGSTCMNSADECVIWVGSCGRSEGATFDGVPGGTLPVPACHHCSARQVGVRVHCTPHHA
jgi:hypothetical protein